MMENGNLGKLTDQLEGIFRNRQFGIYPLLGGASSRKYFRITFDRPTYFPTPTVLLMVVPLAEITTLTDFMHVAYYLQRHHVPVPKLYQIAESEGWIFLEYLTVPTIEEYVQQNPARVEMLLPQLVDLIIDMQMKCAPEQHCPAFQRRFDYDKYRFEFSFHVEEHLLTKYWQIPDAAKLLHDLAEEISRTLDMDYPIFVHRDFQSSNLFYNENADDGERFYMIDFQDARSGSPIYDLVSCLWDSYLPVSEKLREDLTEKYYRVLPRFNIHWEHAEYRKLIDYTVIQRKLHDAGAFALNYHRFGNTRYVPYIRDAVRMALDKMRNYPQFFGVVQLLEKKL